MPYLRAERNQTNIDQNVDNYKILIRIFPFL